MVVRGLDENADEEMLRYEFSKHAPIKVMLIQHRSFLGTINKIHTLWASAYMKYISLIAGSSPCQRQIYSCVERIRIRAFLFGVFIHSLPVPHSLASDLSLLFSFSISSCYARNKTDLGKNFMIGETFNYSLSLFCTLMLKHIQDFG